VETVYKAISNKAGLLKAVFDVALGGDDEAVPSIERDEVIAQQAEPDPRQKLRRYSEFYVVSAARARPMQQETATWSQDPAQLPKSARLVVHAT
jgi:hypothetical protein